LANGLSAYGLGSIFKLPGAGGIGSAGTIIGIVNGAIPSGPGLPDVKAVRADVFIEQWSPKEPQGKICAIQNTYIQSKYTTPGYSEGGLNYYIPYFDELPTGALADLPHWQDYVSRIPSKIFVSELKHTQTIWTCNEDSETEENVSPITDIDDPGLGLP
jgi:hypothetical protein